MLAALKKRAVVCNIGHFDNEIDTAFMRKNWAWEEVKPQVHKVHRTGAGDFDPQNDDYLILLAEGRLVNLGNATGHPSRIMDGSFANQVLAQIFLFGQKYADLSAAQKAERLTVEVLPKKLDEEVALEMVRGFGGVVTQLTKQQADYIGVTVEGPFKPAYATTVTDSKKGRLQACTDRDFYYVCESFQRSLTVYVFRFFEFPRV
jgi:adenosylhomocysteinase